MNFFKKLFKRSEHFKAHEFIHQAPVYSEGFAQAVRFTQSLGFDTKALELLNTNEDVLDRSGDFVDPVFDAVGIQDRTQAAAQCLKWCHYLQPHFERQLGRRVILTIGQLWTKDICVFGPQFEDIERWVQSGLQAKDFGTGSGLKLHAWLTVETGEIIEPTLLSSMAKFGHQSYSKYNGATVWGRDPNVLNGHRYVPLAVGNKLAEKIAKRSFIPLLANGPDELAMRAYAVLE